MWIFNSEDKGKHTIIQKHFSSVFIAIIFIFYPVVSAQVAVSPITDLTHFFVISPFCLASASTQGTLLPLPDPADEARQLRHCGQRGKHGLRPAGGQTQQGYFSHRGSDGGRSAAAQVPVHLWRLAWERQYSVVLFWEINFTLFCSLTLGLGHLISCILINGAQYFKRISESGIKKMCRNIFVLQQNLTNITMSREADLDFAR